MEWVFRLRDQASGPAADIETQLKKVTGALKLLDIQSKQARLEKLTDPLKKQRLELQLQRDKLLLSKRAVEDHARATSSASRSWTDSLIRWAGSLYILETVARGFRAVGRAALEMSGQVKDAIETRQRGLFGLRASMGTGAGNEFFEQLEKQAQVYGRPPGEIVGLGSSFNTLGASPDMARSLVAAVQDVKVASGGRTDISGAIKSILTSPTLGVGNVEAFGGAFPLKDLWKSLGKRMGMRPGDAEQMLKLGQVRGGEGSPLLGAVQDTIAGLPGAGGAVGNMAKGFADNSLEGSIGRVQTAWEKLLGSLENSKGVKTLQTMLQNLAATLGGAKLQTALTSLANTLGEALKPLTGPEGKRRMEEFFGSLAELLKSTIPMLAMAAKWTDILVRYATGQRDKGAPKNITEEVDQFTKWLADKLGPAMFGSPLSLTPETAGAAVLSSLPGSRAMDPSNQGLRGAERPVMGPMRTGPVTVHVNVDARGATKDDAHAIGNAVKDAIPAALNDGFEQLGVEQGAQ